MSSRIMHGIGSLLVVVGLFAVVSRANGSTRIQKPNVILILADDLGYECLSCNGGLSYKTPNLDRLAASGMRFDRCYVQPLCTPTRVQLMTGQYNIRNYKEFGYLEPDSKTFAHGFKAAGYATCITGKWQLGHGMAGPKLFGFDDYCLWQLTRRPPRYANPGLEINGKVVDFKSGEYGPDLVQRHALDFIGKHKDEPFFLYYPLMLTHAPYQPTPDSADWDPKAMGEQVNRNKKHFGEMISYMDKLMGGLMHHLEQLKIRDNTLIVFVGDNGTGRGMESRLGNRVVTGGKGTTTEAGMHVPLLVSWPAVVKAGQTSTDLVDSTDFLPTMHDAAGVKLLPGQVVDGSSFAPRLRGDVGMGRSHIYCWYAPNQGKLDVPQEFAADARFKLYRDGRFFDYAHDAQEKTPLDPARLDPSGQKARERLASVLREYENVRPVKYPKAK